MVTWLLVILVTLVACATLYYASAGRPVNANAPVVNNPLAAHHRLQLAEIEADIASGRLPRDEGVAAKAELAREIMRANREARPTRSLSARAEAVMVPAALAAAAVIAFGTYAYMGNPGLPADPFAARHEGKVEALASKLNVETAIKEIEARLKKVPGDLRGWQVIAPVYMKLARYADAAHAYRRILALSPPTATTDTDLAEALMAQNGGVAAGEPLHLLENALALDPKAIRPRFYIAGEAMRTRDYKAAKAQWQALVAMGTDNDSWLAAAREGLAAATAGLEGKPLPAPGVQPGAIDASQLPMVAAMVQKLSGRLAKDGGTLAQWTELVRSQLVLKHKGAAQTAYDKARAAYPDALQRRDLDALAAASGLNIGGSGK